VLIPKYIWGNNIVSGETSGLLCPFNVETISSNICFWHHVGLKGFIFLCRQLPCALRTTFNFYLNEEGSLHFSVMFLAVIAALVAGTEYRVFCEESQLSKQPSEMFSPSPYDSSSK
jgi:hypothetical protein